MFSHPPYSPSISPVTVSNSQLKIAHKEIAFNGIHKIQMSGTD